MKKSVDGCIETSYISKIKENDSKLKEDSYYSKGNLSERRKI